MSSSVSPQLERDVDRLEKVQRRAIKMIKGLESLPCKARQKGLGLFFLKKSQRGPHRSIPALKGQLQKGQRLSLDREQYREGNGQLIQIALGEILS